MARLFVLLFFAQIALAAVALISCLSAEEDEIRALPRLGWVLIILLLPVVGPIIWFYAGRPVATAEAAEPATGPGWVTPSGRSERQKPRPIAPDDDPEFLRSLGTRGQHPTGGPSARPSAHPDAGPSAHPNAGPSAHPDAGPSAHPDAGPSAHPDAGASAGPSAGLDAGPAAAPDAGGEAGSDPPEDRRPG
jgi:hypothetical protein